MEQITDCRLPGKFRLNKKEVTNPIAVGDFVRYTIGDDGSGSITEIV
jgi:ribosome biogenesis GTPase / thiamine phosphate phosphatase